MSRRFRGRCDSSRRAVNESIGAIHGLCVSACGRVLLLRNLTFRSLACGSVVTIPSQLELELSSTNVNGAKPLHSDARRCLFEVEDMDMTVDAQRIATLRGLARNVHGRLALGPDLSAIWASVTRRELEIVDAFSDEHCSYLILRLRSGERISPKERSLQMLLRVLVGENRKEVSSDFGVSSSTLAALLRRELLDIGLACPPSRVPQVLVMLAHGARGFENPGHSFLGNVQCDEQEYLVVGNQLDSALIRSLPPAVRAVVKQRVEGSSHADIAVQRQTSCRTVANQLAVAFQRLGVSGRLDLLHRILCPLPPTKRPAFPATRRGNCASESTAEI